MTPVSSHPRAKAIEAMARAIYEGPDQYGRPSSIAWQEMLTYGGAAPGNTDHPIADNFREMARLALAALEQEGLVLTDTREAQRLREALTEIHTAAGPRRTERAQGGHDDDIS